MMTRAPFTTMMLTMIIARNDNHRHSPHLFNHSGDAPSSVSATCSLHTASGTATTCWLTLPTYTPKSTLVFNLIIHTSGLFPTKMIHHLTAISTFDINTRHSLPVLDLRHYGSEDRMSTTSLLPLVAEVATLLASDTTASSAGAADCACARLHPHSIATFFQRRTFPLGS